MTKRNMFIDPYQTRLAELAGEETKVDETSSGGGGEEKVEEVVEEEEEVLEVIGREEALSGGMGGLDPSANAFSLEELQGECPEG